MSCLLLRLAGPMQSWGTQSRFSERDTGREPSKCGVIGILCAAMGIDRSDTEALKRFNSLKMGVRIDRAGQMKREYQTAGGGDWNGGFYDLKKYGVYRASGAVGDTVLSSRYYLVDALFHAALQSDDVDFLKELKEALRNPKWVIYLGRKSYVPSYPLCLDIHDGDVINVLKQIPYQLYQREREEPKPLQVVLECEHGEGAARMDVPLSFVKDNRQFGLRFVKYEHIDGFPIKSWKEDGDVSISTHTESVA